MKILKINIERILWISLIVILISTVFIILNINNKVVISTPDEQQDKQARFTRLLEDATNLVKENYVDKKKANYKDLYYGAIRGLLEATENKWTLFYDEMEWKELWQRLDGKLVGIGIYVTEDKYRKGVPVVIEPIKDSPAFKSGIISRDKIIKINGEITEEKDFLENINKISGEKGTKVTLTVERATSIFFDVTITRAEVKVYTVDYNIVQNDIGFIKMRRFSNDTDKDLLEALKTLKQKGMKKLIIDLRNNPGGLFDVCLRVCDMFLESGVICSTKGRRAYDNKTFEASKNTECKDVPLVLLVNGGTASASEIFAGAVKDNKRGTILGTKTYGKGMVASVISLMSSPEPIGVSIVIQKYFTPNGTDINYVGITPDVVVEPIKYNDDDIFYLRKIQYEKEIDLIYEFVNKNKNFTENDIKNFHQNLLKEGYIITYNVLKSEVIYERDRYTLKLFDIENDIQLQKAIEIITKK